MRVASDGLGRIRRATLRVLQATPGMESVAANGLVPIGNLAHLNRDNTVDGRHSTNVVADGDPLSVGDHSFTTRTRVGLADDFDGVVLRLPGVLGVIDDPLVSSGVPLVSLGIRGDSRGSVVDAEMPRLVGGNLVEVRDWYGNEWSYASQMVRHAVARACSKVGSAS